MCHLLLQLRLQADEYLEVMKYVVVVAFVFMVGIWLSPKERERDARESIDLPHVKIRH